MSNRTITHSSGGKAAYFEVGIWRDENSTIHLTTQAGPGIHVVINRDHENLYRQLEKCFEYGRDNVKG